MYPSGVLVTSFCMGLQPAKIASSIELASYLERG